MAHPLVRALRTALGANADPVRAEGVQKYMKSAMPYYGVNMPVLRRICGELFSAHQFESRDELHAVALELWRGAKFREERYAAIAITDQPRYQSWQGMRAVPTYEEMIVTGAWWDYVDPIATHHLGDVLRREPRRMKPLMRRWSGAGDSMWKRRAAIICQIGFKSDTDLDLLYACIEPNLSHKDFFIRKAIGWALRQYAWTDPREVKRYVAANRARLSLLSVREALKNLA
jgi:3-methyladenine DNA glycosylase AlkD